jgi:hypothetical protein
MALPRDHDGLEMSGSVTPTSHFGVVDEKHSRMHEIGLSPQNTERSLLEDSTEELTTGQKRSLLWAKYKIFFHLFLWLLFTG